GRIMLTAKRLAAEEGLPGYRVAMSVNREGGQVVFHAHLHVLGGRRLKGELGGLRFPLGLQRDNEFVQPSVAFVPPPTDRFRLHGLLDRAARLDEVPAVVEAAVSEMCSEFAEPMLQIGCILDVGRVSANSRGIDELTP